MMNDNIKHLTDEQLIDFRDGELADDALVAHMEVCNYCQAMLQELKTAQELFEASRELDITSSSVERTQVMRSYSVDLRLEQETVAMSSLIEESPSHTEEDTFSKDMQERMVKKLSMPPRRLKLGSLEVLVIEDSGVILQKVSAPLKKSSAPLKKSKVQKKKAPWIPGLRREQPINGSQVSLLASHADRLFEPEATVYRAGNYQLALIGRQLGFSTVLVIRIIDINTEQPSPDIEVTLVPSQGEFTARQTNAEGMVWFTLPAGEAQLLIHLDPTYEIHLQKLFHTKV
jgi:hypothetical protein